MSNLIDDVDFEEFLDYLTNEAPPAQNPPPRLIIPSEQDEQSINKQLNNNLSIASSPATNEFSDFIDITQFENGGFAQKLSANNNIQQFLKNYYIEFSNKFKSESLIKTLYDGRKYTKDTPIKDLIEELMKVNFQNPNSISSFVKKNNLLRWHLYMIAYQIAHTYLSLTRKYSGLISKVERNAKLQKSERESQIKKLRGKIQSYNSEYKHNSQTLKNFITKVFSGENQDIAESIYPLSEITDLDPKLEENISFEIQKGTQIPGVSAKNLKNYFLFLIRLHIVSNIVSEKLQTSVDFSSLDNADKCILWNSYIRKIGVKQERTYYSDKSDLQNEYLFTSNDPNRPGWIEKFFSSPAMKLNIIKKIDELIFSTNPVLQSFYGLNEPNQSSMMKNFCTWAINFKRQIFIALKSISFNEVLKNNAATANWKDMFDYSTGVPQPFIMQIPIVSGYKVINKATLRDIVVQTLFHPNSVNHPENVQKAPGSDFTTILIHELQKYSSQNLKDESMVYMKISTFIDNFVNWIVNGFVKTPKNPSNLNDVDDYMQIPLGVDQIYTFADNENHLNLLSKLSADISLAASDESVAKELEAIGSIPDSFAIPINEESKQKMVQDFQNYVINGVVTNEYELTLLNKRIQNANNLLALGIQWCSLFEISLRENLINLVEQVLKYSWNGQKVNLLNRPVWFPEVYENLMIKEFDWLKNWADIELSWQNEMNDSIFAEHLHDKRAFQHYKDLISTGIFANPMHTSNISDPTLFDLNKLDQDYALIYNYADRLAKIINPSKNLQSNPVSSNVWDSNVWLRSRLGNQTNDYSNYVDFTESYPIILTDRSNIKNRLHFFSNNVPIQLSNITKQSDVVFAERNFLIDDVFPKTWKEQNSNETLIYVSRFFLNLHLAVNDARDNTIAHFSDFTHNANPFEDYFYEYSIDSGLLNLSARMVNKESPLFDSLSVEMSNGILSNYGKFINSSLKPPINPSDPNYSNLIPIVISNENGLAQVSAVPIKNITFLNGLREHFYEKDTYTDGLWYIKKGDKKYCISKESSSFVVSCEKHSIHHRKLILQLMNSMETDLRLFLII